MELVVALGDAGEVGLDDLAAPSARPPRDGGGDRGGGGMRGGRSRLLPQDGGDPEAAALGGGGLGQDLVAVEGSAGHVGPEHVGSG